MRSKILDRLHLVYLPEAETCSPLPSSGLDAGTVEEIRRKYVSRLSNWSSSWPSGSLNSSCPHPVMITQRHHEELSNLHFALNLALEDIIERWWTDEEARFP